MLHFHDRVGSHFQPSALKMKKVRRSAIFGSPSSFSRNWATGELRENGVAASFCPDDSFQAAARSGETATSPTLSRMSSMSSMPAVASDAVVIGPLHASLSAVEPAGLR